MVVCGGGGGYNRNHGVVNTSGIVLVQEQRLCHVMLEVAATSDGMGVHWTWNSVLVVLLHGRADGPGTGWWGTA